MPTADRAATGASAKVCGKAENEEAAVTGGFFFVRTLARTII